MASVLRKRAGGKRPYVHAPTCSLGPCRSSSPENGVLLDAKRIVCRWPSKALRIEPAGKSRTPRQRDVFHMRSRKFGYKIRCLGGSVTPCKPDALEPSRACRSRSIWRDFVMTGFLARDRPAKLPTGRASRLFCAVPGHASPKCPCGGPILYRAGHLQSKRKKAGSSCSRLLIRPCADDPSSKNGYEATPRA